MVAIQVQNLDGSISLVETQGNLLISQNEVMIHDKMIIRETILAGSVDNHLVTITEGLWKVHKVSYLPRVAGTGGAATLAINVTAPGDAPASGVAQLAAGIDLESTADVLLSPAVIGTGGEPQTLYAGYSVSMVFTGTKTSLVGCLTVELKRIS